jgi:L-galactose dehydrogenase/L-glyceraldehyde 3-phosphate reductase
LGAPDVEPIGSGSSYRIDVARARRLSPLVDEGFADSLIEAAIRFAIANHAVATALVGTSTLDQLDCALDAADKGPLPPAALARLAALQETFVGEAR